MSTRKMTGRSGVDGTTVSLPSVSREPGSNELLVLTILCHPEPDRVGEEAVLSELLQGDKATLSRNYPFFASPQGGLTRALADRHLSRQPLVFSPTPEGGLSLKPPVVGNPSFELQGRPLDGPETLSTEQLDAGVTLLLKRRVALRLHCLKWLDRRPPQFGLVGESLAMLRLRREIERVSQLSHPVLLSGESGTGKELVARALHEQSPRKSGPFIAINMATLPPSLATAELFGSDKGSFTGADRRRPGHYQRADGGSLFLDEVGDCPPEVQAILLRALETNQIQPLGQDRPIQVDVRLISATELDLHQAVAEGRFRSSLYHRLTTCELNLPALRERKEDIGRLFFYFLEQEVSDSETASPKSLPKVPADLIAKLTMYHWPGNVRELRNIVRKLVISCQGPGELSLSSALARRLEAPAAGTKESSHSEPASKPRRKAEAVTSGELIEAYRSCRFKIKETADRLGVTRGTLYRLIQDCPQTRIASEISQEELQTAIEQTQRDIHRMVDLLEVSARGLRLRMTELGL